MLSIVEDLILVVDSWQDILLPLLCYLSCTDYQKDGTRFHVAKEEVQAEKSHMTFLEPLPTVSKGQNLGSNSRFLTAEVFLTSVVIRGLGNLPHITGNCDSPLNS